MRRSYGIGAELVAEAGLAMDAAIAPGGLLGGQANDQGAQAGGEGGSTWPGRCGGPASGHQLSVARYARNDRLADALHQQQGVGALTSSPGARAYYDTLRARGIGHHAALRQLANRLVGILHGCLKTGRCYDEDTAWAHHSEQHQHDAA